MVGSIATLTLLEALDGDLVRGCCTVNDITALLLGEDFVRVGQMDTRGNRTVEDDQREWSLASRGTQMDRIFGSG